MLDIPAIPTRYNRRFFRSRLEARWAVFFDAMGIEYEYEPEGFQLSRGVRYLPDFWLPRFGWYAEVKPTIEAFKQNPKALRFADEFYSSVLILDGPPGLRSYVGIERDMPPDFDYSLDIYWFNSKLLSENRFWSMPDYHSSPGEDNFSDRYKAAVEAALSARF